MNSLQSSKKFKIFGLPKTLNSITNPLKNKFREFRFQIEETFHRTKSRFMSSPPLREPSRPEELDIEPADYARTRAYVTAGAERCSLTRMYAKHVRNTVDTSISCAWASLWRRLTLATTSSRSYQSITTLSRRGEETCP